jgi:carbamoyltransferase
MTAILGLSAYYHDSAAALVVDGHIVAAAQEERFSRRKHDASFPRRAIDYCLATAGLKVADLNYVGFYDKPLLKFDRLLASYLATAPRGFASFLHAMPLWLRDKLFLPSLLKRELGGDYRQRIVFTEHHESHAASAFFPSPFASAAILTVDGVGEWATATIGRGRGHQIEILQEQHFPHSLGLLYSAFTSFCGFRVNSGEYKLMGLAPYGQPRFVQEIYDKLIDLKDDGSFRLDQSYFNYVAGLTMTSAKFAQLFGGPPRQPEREITQREMDLAASIQTVTNEIMCRMARHAREITGERNLCLAGGVALNCVSNSQILQQQIFDQVWIQPAAGDAGGALGVALFIWHQLLENSRQPEPQDSQQGSLLGPAFDQEQIRKTLDEFGANYECFGSDDELCDHVAQQLSEQKVVGWFQGRMEFGPRALGSRSILADARNPLMKSLLNQKIKYRESFRPFAPAVLQECAHEYFDLPAGHASPYMQFVAPLVAGQQLPAVTHVDNSARVQTVDPQRQPLLHQLLQRFRALTGCGVLINTSFNVRGEPIVCDVADAYRCFQATEIDVLVVGRCVLLKRNQTLPAAASEQHLAAFELD